MSAVVMELIPRGRRACPACGQVVRIKADGNLANHRDRRTRRLCVKVRGQLSLLDGLKGSGRDL